MGHTKNPDIRIAKSIVDYIFRWLGITFLPGYREAMFGHPAADEAPAGSALAGSALAEVETEPHPAATPGSQPDANRAATPPAGKARPVSNGASPKTTADSATLLEKAGVMKVDLNGGNFNTRAEMFASFQTDAPSCDNCGAITVRNGNCYMCHNCGNSMGCS
jgi:ribonucleoside-diphosphate reductase alpha chain